MLPLSRKLNRLQARRERRALIDIVAALKLQPLFNNLKSKKVTPFTCVLLLENYNQFEAYQPI